MLIAGTYLAQNIYIIQDFASLEGEETLSDLLLANLHLSVCYSQGASQATLPLAAQKQRILVRAV